jgi:hypothetical protein
MTIRVSLKVCATMNAATGRGRVTFCRLTFGTEWATPAAGGCHGRSLKPAIDARPPLDGGWRGGGAGRGRDAARLRATLTLTGTDQVVT